MYKTDKHNAADVSSKQPNYISEVKKDSCLFMLQSKLKAMRTVISESFKLLRRKLNEINHIKCVSDVFALIRCKLIIKDESEIN